MNMRTALSSLALATAVAGCNASIANPLDLPRASVTVIAERAVVAADTHAKRVAVLVPGVEGTLARTYLPLASPPVQVITSDDGARTFVLTAGVEKTRTAPAIAPELIVIGVAGSSVVEARYPMPRGSARLWLDPLGAYVAVTPAAAGSGALVTNPDALALVKLDAPASATNPVVRSLVRSESVSEAIVFSPSLTTPRGAKRFLLGVGVREVALVDLAAAFTAAPAPDTKVPLTSSGATSSLRPLKVRFDDGDPAATGDARLAFALAGEGSILTATLAANDAPAAGESDLRAIVNLTDVGAPVSDLDFLATPDGLRIAALTPSRARAVLADPATSLVTPVPLARAYASLRVLPSSSGSTVLLAQPGGSTGAVALWDVPRTADQPYRAVEPVVDVAKLASVRPIPGSSTRFLVTGEGGYELVVLDVATRATTAVDVAGASSVQLSRDGERAYVVPASGATTFAALNLRTFAASPFAAGLPRGAVGELRRADGTPVVAVIHGDAGASLSLFDPQRPEALGVRWDDLLTEGVR
jgi:hypothetical protein